MTLKLSPWTKRILAVVFLAGVFGTLGYLVSPKPAAAIVTVDDEARTALAGQLRQVRTDKDGLTKQLAQVKEDLAAAADQAKVTAELLEGQKQLTSEADALAGDLIEQLDLADHANLPMQRRLAAAQGEAAEAWALAEQATVRADLLAVETAALARNRDDLNGLRKQMIAQKSGLETALARQSYQAARANVLLETLSFGRGQAPPAASSSSSPEMPITARELVACLGQPSVTVQEATGQQKLRWGSRHSAWSEEGLVTTIDGQPASRSLLASVAPTPPGVVAAPGAWVHASGDALSYAELVALWGQPEGLSGTGKRFDAWWAVGAWARPVWATVADGLVQRLDGQAVNAPAVCELVRHRAEAYEEVNTAVEAASRGARWAYQQAVKVIGDNLAEESAELAKDGRKLTSWGIAPLDSVGTWIGCASAVPDALTVRTWVDAAWTADDGAKTTQRRYVVVTLRSNQGQAEKLDFAIFAPRK